MSLVNMEKKSNSGLFNLFILGLFVWLIPFVVSFFFYTPQGTPIVGAGFFNSIMSVVLAIVTTAFLLMYFKGISRGFLAEGIKAGIVWIVMSIVLDMIFLVTWAKMDLGMYLTDIALGYAVILIVAVFAGILLEEKSEHSKKLYSQIFSVKK